MNGIKVCLALIAILVASLALTGGGDDNPSSADSGNTPDEIVAAEATEQATNADGPTWRFAYNPGSLIAFSLDGTVKVLREAVNNIGNPCFQVGPQNALFRWDDGSDKSWLRLTPDAAYSLMIPADLVKFSDEIWEMVAYSDPYAILLVPTDPTSMIPAGVGLLVNVETGTTERLVGEARRDSWETITRFSADGRYLRYASQEVSATGMWTLWERTLASGEERAIYTWDKRPDLQPDRYGERWLPRSDLQSETGIELYSLLSLDGTSSVIAELPQDEGMTVRMLGNAWIKYPRSTCEPDCPFQVYLLAGGDPITFVAPEYDKGPGIKPLAWVDESHLLVQLLDEIWFLSSDGSSELIGYLTPTMTDPLSPDGRWMLVTNDREDTEHYRIWDNQTQGYVLEGEHDQDFGVFYSREGFVVVENALDWSQIVVYSFADGVVFRPSFDGGGLTTAEVFPSNEVLYRPSKDDENLPSGLYRYHLETDTYDLLVEGFWFSCGVYLR